MHNAKPIIIGIAAFVILVTVPFWFNLGKAAYTPPDLKYPDKTVATECIEPKDVMKATHMQILNDWRDEVVRRDRRIYVSSTGKQYEMSLQNTCMKCHDDKEKFCDKCHATLSVDPYCWTCHIEPKAKGAK